MNKSLAKQVIRRSGGKFDEQQRDILVKMIEALPDSGGGGGSTTLAISSTPLEGGAGAADMWLSGSEIENGVGLKLDGDSSSGYTLSLVVQGEG